MFGVSKIYWPSFSTYAVLDMYVVHVVHDIFVSNKTLYVIIFVIEKCFKVFKYTVWRKWKSSSEIRDIFVYIETVESSKKINRINGMRFAVKVKFYAPNIILGVLHERYLPSHARFQCSIERVILFLRLKNIFLYNFEKKKNLREGSRTLIQMHTYILMCACIYIYNTYSLV